MEDPMAKNNQDILKKNKKLVNLALLDIKNP